MSVHEFNWINCTGGLQFSLISVLTYEFDNRSGKFPKNENKKEEQEEPDYLSDV